MSHDKRCAGDQRKPPRKIRKGGITRAAKTPKCPRCGSIACLGCE